MKKLMIGLLALVTFSGNAFAHTYLCNTQRVEDKVRGYVYVKNDHEVVSVDIDERYDDPKDEKSLHVVYRLNVNGEMIQRKAYLNKNRARQNSSAVLNRLDDMAARITDEVDGIKISLFLDIWDMSLQARLDSKERGIETVRLNQSCSEEVLLNI